MSSKPKEIQMNTGIEPIELRETPNSDQRLSKDDLFDILSNHRRRYVLHYLQRHDDPVSLGDLSEQIAAWENSISLNDITSNDRKRVYTSLQQFHLPKMKQRGVVEYDHRESTVELSSEADDLTIYLDIVDDSEIPWSWYYAGLAVLNVLTVAAVWLDIPPFFLISDLVWAGFFASVFTASAVVHIYSNSQMRLGRDTRPPELLNQ